MFLSVLGGILGVGECLKIGGFHSLSLIFYYSVSGMIWKSGFIVL